MENLNEDMVDVLELREKQLTEMIRMLQKKRRDVRAAITRLKAETLQPVPVANPFKTRGPQENSGGNNQASGGCSHSPTGPLDSCPDECY